MTEVSEQRPLRDPSSLPEDIYKILEDDTDHVVSEANVEWAGEIFKDILRSRLAKREQKSGENVLRFSSLGKPDRQIWYDAHESDKAEKLPGKVKFKFLYGDVIEVLALFLAKEAGHTVEDTQLEVEEDGVHGHIDAKIDGVLTDVKSCSTYSFRKFVTSDYLFDDPFGYVSQLSAYSHKLDTKRAGYLVVDKSNGDIAYVELPEEYIRGNPPGPRIAKLRNVLANTTPPPRCYPDKAEGKSGNRVLGVGCSYCPHKENCWSDANDGKGLRKFYYASGPKWFTKVVKEPKVDEA